MRTVQHKRMHGGLIYNTCWDDWRRPISRRSLTQNSHGAFTTSI